MNIYVKDLMKLLGIEEKLAKEVLLVMERTGLDFSECTTSEFNLEAKYAYLVVMFGEEFMQSKDKGSLREYE